MKCMLTLSIHLFLAPVAYGMVSLLPHGGIIRPPGPPTPIFDLPPQGCGDSKGQGKISTPGQPSTPTVPTTPSSGQKTPRSTPRGSQGGITIGIDGSTWNYWWEYNKSALLLPRLLEAEPTTGLVSGENLIGRGARKERARTRRPGPGDAKRIAEALRSQLVAKESDYQMRGSCLLSLAKTGHTNLRDMAPHLADAHPVVRESAILAMGIAGIGEDELHALLIGDAEGTRLCGGKGPGFRERSFAGYALGFLARRSKDPEVKKRVLESMIQRVGDKRERMDVRVAALHALRMLDLPPEARAERKLQLQTIQALAVETEVVKNTLIQVQALTALRGPLATQGHARERMERKMAKTLAGGKPTAVVRQSLTQTLGFLADSEDLDVIQALERTVLRDKDELTRRYAMMALGRIGGEQAQDFLLEGIQARRPRNAEYAWLALALALSCQEEQADGTLAYKTPRPGIGEALHSRFKSLNSRMPAAGVAIALGLLRHSASVSDIELRLTRWQKHDEPAAYLALALGLMRNTDSTDRITSMLENAKHREILVVQTSLALSLLGDTNAEAKLQAMLETPQTTPVLSAVAMGMGRLGTRASIDTMIYRLASREGNSTSRAFMAVALGELLIQKRLRWNAPLSWGIHYRYSPATLTGNNGVLDLL
jgi:HEAT repeat protein